MKKETLELPETICGKSIEEIRGMRNQHGHLFVVIIADGDDKYHAVCKEPTMSVVDASQTIGKESDTKGAMCLYDNCVVLADEDIKQRDMLKLQVASAIIDKIGQLGTTAKNV